MTWQDYLRDARDDLLAEGKAITPGDVVDRALESASAQELFQSEAEGRARAAARRLASSLLRDTEQPGGDEQTARLFDVVTYSPPRCVTIRDAEGDARHKAIEHATVPDCDAYEDELERNIAAATRRLFDFRSFRAQIKAELAKHGTVGDALRALKRHRAA